MRKLRFFEPPAAEAELIMKKIDISKLLCEKETVTLDIVGDSITHGLNHCSADETYTAQFACMLAEKFTEASVNRYDGIVSSGEKPMAYFDGPIEAAVRNGNKHIDVIRNGIGGNTVRRAIERIGDFTGTLANGRTADVTFFMFGINDALKSDSKKYVTAEKFYEDYSELIEKFRKIEDSAIVIMSATTNDQTIDAHVAETARLAAEYGFIYIDQHKVWDAHYDPAASNFGQGDWLSNEDARDACHPSPLGAKMIASEMMKYVE